MFGWGLMNTLKAAQLIKADSSAHDRIREESLANGSTKEYYITSDGSSAIRISVAWTDLPGTPPAASLNPTTPMLVNDLDPRLIRVATSTVYQPYVLNPASPSSAATTGDNTRDNVEQVYLASPAAGQYRITVTHKGTLASPQTFSLVSSSAIGTGDTQAPTVTVTAPDGGEVWDIGTSYDITWTATDNLGVTSISILLSRDGGATYPETLATGKANDGLYAWLATEPATTTARVKVIAYDAATNSGEDVSNVDFEIYDPAAGVTEQGIPSRLVVVGGVPNPMVEGTRIRFGLPAPGKAELDVFDVSGRKVATLPSGFYPAGYHEVEWSPTPGSCGSGIYFLRVRFGQEETTTKIVVWR
jgi:Kre9/KNH-like N-terminal Ig-like domain